MFENGCYLRRQKRFKCPLRQAQKAAQRAAAAAAGRLSSESGTSATRDLNRKLSDDVISGRRRRTPNATADPPGRGSTGNSVTSSRSVAAWSRDRNRKLSDDVITSGERRSPSDDRRQYSNCVGDSVMRPGLSENQNGVIGGHVTYDASISGGSYRATHNSEKATCSLPHYRYQQQTVFFCVYFVIYLG